jgi:quercetin dioxygenase-like cupin family protein
MTEKLQVFSWSEMPKETLWDGKLLRTAIRSDGAIAAINWHQPNTPRKAQHNHPFDQLVLIVSGTLGMSVGDDEITLGPGTAVRIPANVPHTGWTIGDEVVLNIDIFAPVREDYLFLAVNQSEYGDVPAQQSKGTIPTIADNNSIKVSA